MSTTDSVRAARRLVLLALTATAATLALPATVAAVPGPVPAPRVPGVAPLPGLVAPASKPAERMGILKITPDTGSAGRPITIRGTGLPANTELALHWATANATWQLDARPDSVDYLGRKTDKVNVTLAGARTDANGAFTLKLKAPADFGGIHDVYAVVNGVQLAKGGFLIERKATMTPRRGPVGTMVTITYSGLSASLYGGSGAIYYDNKFTGALTGVWTRGVAKVRIRAAGPVGKHVVQVAEAVTFHYLNGQQSPLPWAVDGVFTFTVTKGRAHLPARIDWPAAVAPTLDQRTTLDTLGLSTGSARARLGRTSGIVGSKVDVSATGLEPGAAVDVAWATVVGNRVNCTGTCWSFVQVPLGKATAAADGSVTTSFSVPDNLGGWHVVQLLQHGTVAAQTPFYVKRSIVGISRLRLKAGQRFTVHLKGIGWTQMDNTIAVDYDNSYVGYACGFNSNGDVVINLIATGAPGTHLIDMYPLLYTTQPSYPNTPYGMVPILTYARDFPGLALGYQLPAMRMAIEIVK